MNRRRTRARVLRSSFSRRIGAEILNVRIYRDGEAYACERELIERDGTSFTMVKPFKELNDVRELLLADPYFPRVRAEAGRLLDALDRVLREHGKKAA